jgi:small conductance mechanosensitive channel
MVDIDFLLQTWRTLVERGLLFVPKFLSALLIFLVAFYTAGLLTRLVRRGLVLRQIDPELTVLLSRLTRWSIVLIGTVWGLDQINFDVGSFVAGLGIIGFTLGFAFQDIAKNFIAGVLLLLQQPFDIGDSIEVAGFGGIVTDIEVRATTLRSWDGLSVIIPNADVYTNAITNYTTATRRRVTLNVGVGYESVLDQVAQTMSSELLKIPGVIQDDPAPSIVFDAFGDSAINATAYFWIDTAAIGLLEAQTRAVSGIKQAFEREGINIPYPVRTILNA